jgi:hypothetical protein
MRTGIERQATKAGVKLTGSVSGKTAYVVTGRKVQGTKKRDAERVGARKGIPHEFDALLQYVQPAPPVPAKVSAVEEFVCAECSKVFSRERGSGSEPVRYPECRSWE